MNIAIISNPASPNTADLVQAIRAAHADYAVYAVKDLALSIENLDSHPFFAHDAYIFRGYNKSYAFALSLAESLSRRGKLVIDEQLVNGFIPSKLHEALVYKDAHIPHIPTYVARRFESLEQIGFPDDYPVVVKDVDSQRGKGVRLVQNQEELRHEIETHGGDIIIQKFLSLAYDVRVLCVGDTIIGAIKRESQDDEFRTNVSLGGAVSSYELSEQEKTLALSAHAAMGYDISGVDIAHDDQGNAVVIETNITPEWQGFKAATGIDVAAKIIEYVIERAENNG